MISLKINNYFVNNPNLIDNTFFKQGAIFKGKILDLFMDEVLIEVKEYGTLKATLDTDIQINIGDEINFLVKSSKGQQIEIKPLHLNIPEGSNILDNNIKNNILKKVLDNLNNKSLNIKDNKLSIDLTKSLMENNIHLSEENLTTSIKLLDKFVELSYLDEDNKVIFVEGKDGIKKGSNYEDSIIRTTPTSREENIVITRPLSPYKTHVKHLLITDRDSYPEKEDLSLIVKDFLHGEDNVKLEELPKIISFMMKNNIQPSLNNFQNIRELNKNPETFLKDFAFKKQTFKDFIKNNIEKKDFLNHIKLLQENLDNKQELNIDEFSKLEKIIKEIESFKIQNIDEEIVLFKDKIDFFMELNKDLSFMFLPITKELDDLEGIVSFLKRKSKKSKNNKINVFISLNTKTLGDVKISCQLNIKTINIKMKIDKSDFKLFKSQEDILIKKIESIGYNLNNLEYIFEEELKLIDQIVINDNPTYFLDIKV